MHKNCGAYLLMGSIVLAASAVSFVPSGLALVAGGNKISALSKSPNAATDWLIEHGCRTIKSAALELTSTVFIVLGFVYSFLLPIIVFGTNQLYRCGIKKWPRCDPDRTPHERNSNHLFMKCYHKLIPGREVLCTFATFLIFATGFAIVTVETVVSSFKTELNKGFYTPLYGCLPVEPMPDAINQIIKNMAKPVALAARAAGHSTTLFLIPTVSVFVLFVAKIVGFRREQQVGQRQRLIAEAAKRATEGINYGTNF